MRRSEAMVHASLAGALTGSAAHEERLPLTPLQRWLRLLWVPDPILTAPTGSMVSDAGDRPRLVGNTILLPAIDDAVEPWTWYRAATAHAAAHRAFSPAAIDCRGLPPISRALLGLLEDARIEALAGRELPGLLRLWQPLHRASPHDGDRFETLMLRLARGLVDPRYADPHPWVRKGRRLFFVDEAQQSLALRRADDLRLAATLLGNDIGQMRLGFDARGYRPGPDYRDDMSWLDGGGQAQPGVSLPNPSELAPQLPAPVTVIHRYPEWDRLIRRLRQDWCVVSERRVEPAAGVAGRRATIGDGAATLAACAELTRRQGDLARVMLRTRADQRSRGRSASEGDRLDPDALVRLRLARHQGEPIDPRIWRCDVRRRGGEQIVIAIDQSASSARPWGGVGIDLLQAGSQVAVRLAAAWQQLGVSVSICGFRSHGRKAVSIDLVKSRDEPLGPPVFARLAALRSEGSTRLGAVIRHLARQLTEQGGDEVRQLLLIGDGQPFDIDIHDPRYLVADARHAVRLARCRRVRVGCLLLDAAGDQPARHVFGAGRYGLLESSAALPERARRLAL